MAKPRRRLALAVVAAAALLGAAVGWAIRSDAPLAQARDPQGIAEPDLAALKARFRRPPAVPFPADNAYGEAKARLGRTLFFDPRLSGGGTLACAGCHDPAKGWSDARKTARGERGQELQRRTPALWNLAWAEKLFWDGRADSLEHQALMPIDNPDEMDRRPDDLAAWLNADADYRAAFAAAFPAAARLGKREIAQALATYVRTLVSPPTAFDRWIEGDATAISSAARRGFLLFTGNANCAACHTGWNFTDQAFHDIGLPPAPERPGGDPVGGDRGRGAILNLPAVYFAFKTPGLRDLANRAPYMHDGAVATLAAVIAHYESGIVARPSLSRDMKAIALGESERAELLAFLETLSTPGPADTAPPVRAAAAAPPLGPAAETRIVAQRDKAFLPAHVRVARTAATLFVRNDDTRTHNVRVHDPSSPSTAARRSRAKPCGSRFPRPAATRCSAASTRR